MLVKLKKKLKIGLAQRVAVVKEIELASPQANQSAHKPSRYTHAPGHTQAIS